MSNLLSCLKPGVISGDNLNNIYKYLKNNKIALPAINCIDSNTVNAVLEASRKYRSIVVIQFSYSGSKFFIGNLENEDVTSAVKGSILGAMYVHRASKFYNVPVVLHTDHCVNNNLHWINGLLNYNKYYFSKNNKSLFSSHMIDLSSMDLNENILISKKYLKKMSSKNINLEVEIGCTGGEEDGLDNSNVSNDKLYSHPKDILLFYKEFKKISGMFSIAASFGNTHGVYRAGNINLKPKILFESQKLVKNYYSYKEVNPVNFVFHGGSGTDESIIKESINYGVVKINLDTDIQWSSWKGVLKYYKKNKYYLKKQLGNPLGLYSPNKKFYDPRIWIRKSQISIIKYLSRMFKILNCKNLF